MVEGSKRSTKMITTSRRGANIMPATDKKMDFPGEKKKRSPVGKHGGGKTSKNPNIFCRNGQKPKEAPKTKQSRREGLKKGWQEGADGVK